MSTTHTQYLRVYSTPTPKPVQDAKEKQSENQTIKRPLSTEVQAIQDSLKPWGGKTLVLDTETTTGVHQDLRFGFYEIHGLSKNEMFARYRDGTLKPEDADILRECGIFYDETTLLPDELALLEKYADRVTLEHIAKREGVACDADYERMRFLNRDEFIKLFYGLQAQSELVVLGHNLPFDIAVLATEWTEARGEYANGFSLKLCNCNTKLGPHGKQPCPAHPNIRMKRVGFAKTFLKRTASNLNWRFQQLHFVDTLTLSAALLGTAHGLEKLSETLLPQSKKLQKRERPTGITSGESLTLQDVIYGIQDVHCTYACYQELKKQYLSHEISTPIWNMYSSASVGKAHLGEFGIRPFLQQNPDFPPEVLGYSMLAYYGARSEIGVRLQPVEVLYLDFLSQYPSVNTLMHNQEILLAENTTVEDTTSEITTLLEHSSQTLLHMLHDASFWPVLRCFVKVLPDHDRLPLRSDYGPEGKNVGLPFVTSSQAVWYTLADVLASKLLTDKTPTIIQALSLVPSEQHYETTKRNLFGYTVELEEQDFFQTLIELRQRIKEQPGKLAKNQQLSLKLISNATAYGALVEVTQAESASEPQPVVYYDGEGCKKETKVSRVETPGKFFAGPIGSLIPAGGRLLLAIAQRLANERGMVHAMMDTDSIALVRPYGVEREDFQVRASDVAEWFEALSPYEHTKKVLEIEDVNYRWDDKTNTIDKGVLQPLYFVGVSAKRYAVYNRLDDGSYRIRKFTSHGLGGFYAPYANNASPYPDIPNPHKAVHEMGGKRWAYDLWYRFIAFVDGENNPLLYRLRGGELNIPAYHQASLTTYALYRQFQSIPGVRPFGFFSVLPSKAGGVSNATRAWIEEGQEDLEASYQERLSYIAGLDRPFYAPFANTPEDLKDIRRMDTNALVEDWYRLVNVGECVAEYFRHPEYKALNGKMPGVMMPHECTIGNIAYVGKEINSVQLELAEATGGLMGELLKNTQFGEGLVLKQYHVADLAVLTGLSGQAINQIKAGKIHPTQATRTVLQEAVNRLGTKPLLWRSHSNEALATLMGVTPEIIKLMKHGKYKITELQKNMLLAIEEI